MRMQVQQQILKRLNKLEKEMGKIRDAVVDRKVSDSRAEKEISQFLLRRKRGGKQLVSALDVYAELHLPFDQINAILEKLKSKGLKEVD